jgi:hypothetical protein
LATWYLVSFRSGRARIVTQPQRRQQTIPGTESLVECSFFPLTRVLYIVSRALVRSKLERDSKMSGPFSLAAIQRESL